MSFFVNSEQLTLCMRTLFERLRQQDAAMQPLLSSRLIIRLRLEEPEAEITINARTRPVQVTYGPGGGQPVLDVNLSAETLHRILLDTLSVRQAMAQGSVRVIGPFLKALVLVELFRSGQQIYAQVLRDLGLA